MNSDDSATITIGGIKFPVALLDALRERRLVVFAGAGVSMGEPACLPDFGKLADLIAEGTGEKLKDGDNPSLFLDRLADAGVKVHERAAEILRHDSMPTETHKNLLLLFQKYDPVRIVTTNFDLYFEKAVAAENMLNSEVESYRSPALPLGSDFDGIVHVHGSVKRPNDMVLTDTDFGKAYLTDGSARRFLSGAFANYTILFVGYSHNDTILNYLARALPPTDQKRFALISDKSKDEHWDRLKIDRIDYRVSGKNHQALHTGIHALKEFVNRRPTEWRSEIERVVKKSPDNLGDDQNLLEYALEEKTHVASFTNAAESHDWLDWIDNQGYLDGMFDEKSRDERNGLWAHWLVEKFAVAHVDRLLYVIGRREGRLPAYFWVPLAKAVQSNDLNDQEFDQWATLLISKVPEEMDSYPLYQLCKFCAERGLISTSAQIFDLMLTMRPIIKNYMKDMQSSDLEYTPDLDFNRIKLQPVYDLGFQHEMVSWRETVSLFDRLAESLIDPVIRRLEERHRILSAWKKSHRQYDSALTGYTLIESGDMGNDAGINLMICAARDCLDWIVENRSENRAYWRRRLANSESPVLRCLAAHSVRKDANLSPDKKAAWLLETNSLLKLKRLNDSAPYRELYRLAEEIYPELDDERRGFLIEAVGEYRFSMPDGELNAEIDERHRYDWYRVLHRSDPECSLARAAFEAAQNKHPEWKPSPDVGIKVIQGSPSSLNPEQLLARQGFEWVPELPVLFNHVSQNPRINDSVRGLSEAVRKAAMQNFDWGLALADGLAGANEWETEVWSSLLQAWSHGENKGRTGLDKNQYRKVLNRIENENLRGKPERDSFIIRTLNSLVANDGAPYAFELLSETNRIANSLWDKIDERNAVYLAHYWLNVLSLLRRDPDSTHGELEQDWAEASLKIMRDPSPKGRACLSALAGKFSRLLDLDKVWTKENLLPLFSSPNDEEFQVAWKGFLRMQNAYGWNLTKGIAKKLYRQSYKSIKRILPDNNLDEIFFVEFYTDMVMFAVKNPMKRWIPEFFKRSSTENRHRFTEILDLHLSRYEDDDATLHELWKHWFKSYWKNRLQGVPKPLDAVEMGRMLSWPLYFGPYMPEAVNLAIQMKPYQRFGSWVLFKLNTPEIWSNYPKATSKLLLHLSKIPLASGTLGDLHSSGPEIIKNLLALNLPADLKRDLEDLRATLS